MRIIIKMTSLSSLLVGCHIWQTYQIPIIFKISLAIAIFTAVGWLFYSPCKNVENIFIIPNGKHVVVVRSKGERGERTQVIIPDEEISRLIEKAHDIIKEIPKT